MYRRELLIESAERMKEELIPARIGSAKEIEEIRILERDMVIPRNLCSKLLHKFTIGPGSRECPHVLKVPGRVRLYRIGSDILSSGF